jgi:hypothetical protein
MECIARVDPKRLELVLDKIEKQSPKPTELLEILASQLSYTEIQDAVGELLDTGTAKLTADRRLRAVHSAAAG